MCPRKQYSYTSEDYLNRYLDKYARKFREDAKFWPQFIEHISGNHKVPPHSMVFHSMVFYAEPKVAQAIIDKVYKKIGEAQKAD